MVSTESEVLALLANWSQAAQMKDIDRLMSLYSRDIVYFDVVPPLQFVGSDAVRNNFLRWFNGYESSIGVEIRDPRVVTNEDHAAAFMLIRATGTLKDGYEVEYWLRATVCCQRSDHSWVITHEHISLPVDFKTGCAVMNLAP
jgi:ketosteroid isomerase-like protein